jgi:hypothetical protein
LKSLGAAPPLEGIGKALPALSTQLFKEFPMPDGLAQQDDENDSPPTEGIF